VNSSCDTNERSDGVATGPSCSGSATEVTRCFDEERRSVSDRSRGIVDCDERSRSRDLSRDCEPATATDRRRRPKCPAESDRRGNDGRRRPGGKQNPALDRKDSRCQASECDRKTAQRAPGAHSDTGRHSCGQPLDRDDDDDDDALGCLRRRDNETIETYLMRSIMLLGSLANRSNSSAKVHAVKPAVQSVAGTDGPLQAAAYRVRSTEHSSRNAIQQRIWLRSAAPSQNRFSSASGSRYSGNRSTFSYFRGGSKSVRPAMSDSSSFSAMQMADSRLKRSPFIRDWPRGSAYNYRTSRSDRERFSTRHSRPGMTTADSNVNMHANSSENETGDADKRPDNESPKAIETNTNNSRMTQENTGKLATATDSGQT